MRYSNWYHVGVYHMILAGFCIISYFCNSLCEENLHAGGSGKIGLLLTISARLVANQTQCPHAICKYLLFLYGRMHHSTTLYTTLTLPDTIFILIAYFQFVLLRPNPGEHTMASKEETTSAVKICMFNQWTTGSIWWHWENCSCNVNSNKVDVTEDRLAMWENPTWLIDLFG